MIAKVIAKRGPIRGGKEDHMRRRRGGTGKKNKRLDKGRNKLTSGMGDY